MRLFTHNFLQCHVRGCDQNNYPLDISEAEVEKKEVEYNEEFLTNFIHKIDWSALRKAISQVGLDVVLPEVKPEEPLEEELLLKLHSVLFEHYLKSGKMTCPGCGHLFPIKDGIPNMLLVEDEV